MKKEIKKILNDREPKFNKDTKEFGIFIKLGDLRKLKEYIEKVETIQKNSVTEVLLQEFLRLGFKYMAKNKYNSLGVYSSKPEKVDGKDHWYIVLPTDNYLNITSFIYLFPNIQWEDEEALNIEAYLEGLKFLKEVKDNE